MKVCYCFCHYCMFYKVATFAQILFTLFRRDRIRANCNENTKIVTGTVSERSKINDVSSFLIRSINLFLMNI